MSGLNQLSLSIWSANSVYVLWLFYLSPPRLIMADTCCSWQNSHARWSAAGGGMEPTFGQALRGGEAQMSKPEHRRSLSAIFSDIRTMLFFACEIVQALLQFFNHIGKYKGTYKSLKFHHLENTPCVLPGFSLYTRTDRLQGAGSHKACFLPAPWPFISVTKESHAHPWQHCPLEPLLSTHTSAMAKNNSGKKTLTMALK